MHPAVDCRPSKKWQGGRDLPSPGAQTTDRHVHRESMSDLWDTKEVPFLTFGWSFEKNPTYRQNSLCFRLKTVTCQTSICPYIHDGKSHRVFRKPHIYRKVHQSNLAVFNKESLRHLRDLFNLSWLALAARPSYQDRTKARRCARTLWPLVLNCEGSQATMTSS